jgi:hypothetical protein
MKIRNSISNSLRYSAADWYNLLILGVILFLLENLYSLPGNPPGIDIYDLTVIFIIVFLWILESGYIFRIIEETVKGSKKPPKFKRIKEIFVHGLKENIVLLIYLSIPLIIIGLVVLDFKIFLKIIEMNPNIILAYLESSKMIYFSLAIILSAFIYFWYMGVLLNMARYKGSISSGFNFKGISHRLSDAGIKNLILVYFFIIIVATILLVAFSSTIETIPLNIYVWNAGDILIQLFIAPYIIIFAFRMLGLLDQDPVRKEV